MTDDEMELKMEFLLKQQESQSDQISELIEGLGELKQQQEKAQAQTERHSEQIGLMMQAIVGLTAVATPLSKQSEDTNTALKELTAGQAELRERLDVFIVVLERYISENQKGRDGQA